MKRQKQRAKSSYDRINRSSNLEIMPGLDTDVLSKRRFNNPFPRDRNMPALQPRTDVPDSKEQHDGMERRPGSSVNFKTLPRRPHTATSKSSSSKPLDRKVAFAHDDSTSVSESIKSWMSVQSSVQTETSLQSNFELYANRSELHCELDALWKIYRKCNGYQWRTADGWDTTLREHCENRYKENNGLEYSFLKKHTINGVHFNLAGHVEEIILSRNNLEGKLPDCFSNLCHLQTLDWSRNKISGSLPEHAFRNLRDLQVLSLQSNELQGELLPSIVNAMVRLEELWLGDNMLTGAIPEGLGELTNLTHICLYKNRFTGSIPSSFSKLKSLQHLSLGCNQLIGPFPDCVSELVKLHTISIYDNRMDGTIPPWVYEELPLLTTFQVIGNDFDECVPISKYR